MIDGHVYAGVQCGNAKRGNFDGRVHQDVGEETARENIGEGSSLTDETFRLKRDQKVGLGSQDGSGKETEIPGHKSGLYGAGIVGGSRDNWGRFALLEDEDVVENARLLVGEETE